MKRMMATIAAFVGGVLAIPFVPLALPFVLAYKAENGSLGAWDNGADAFLLGIVAAPFFTLAFPFALAIEVWESKGWKNRQTKTN